MSSIHSPVWFQSPVTFTRATGFGTVCENRRLTYSVSYLPLNVSNFSSVGEDKRPLSLRVKSVETWQAFE